MNNERLEDLQNLIKHHSNLYYNDIPEISDYEFDNLVNELERLQPNNEVLNSVGSDTNSDNKLEHSFWMPSIEKCKSVKDLEKFINNNDYVATYKLDGSSLSLYYNSKGIVFKAGTRGNGYIGEDKTNFIKYINNIPNTFENNSVVWGEVLITYDNFNKLVNEMNARNLEPVKNIRNAVAGILNRKDNFDLAKYLTFVAHNFWYEDVDKNILNFEDKLSYLKKYFLIPPTFRNTDSNKIIEQYISDKNNYHFLTDGLVFTLNDKKYCNDLEDKTNHHYRFNIAYKLESDIKNTTVNNITWQVGRTGKVTPVLEIETVNLSGANISRCTGHNYKFIKDNNIGIGTIISITRSNEVIPKCLSAVDKFVYTNNTITHCPECGSILYLSSSKTDLICKNSNCRSIVIGKLLHFVKTLKIDGINDKTMEKLYDNLNVKNIKDLFTLKTNDIICNIDGFKEKSSQNIIDNIKKVVDNGIYYDTFLESLGINNIGYDISKKLFAKYKNFTNLNNNVNNNKFTVNSIEGMGEKIYKILLDNLEHISYIVDELESIGIKLVERKHERNKSINNNTQTNTYKLNGKVFILSGSFSKPKKEIENIIIQNGGVISNSVNKSIDYLVTNENGTAKYNKAISLNKSIIDENKLYEMIK